MGEIYIDSQIKQKIIDEYNNGMSVLGLTKVFPYSYGVIYRVLKENNIIIRNNSFTARKYHCNSNIFHVIDTQEKAYWLGFLYADGYISQINNSYVVGLSLSSVDKTHVEKFRSFLETDYPINEYISSGFKASLYSRIAVNDKIIAEDLIRHGVVLQKTNVLKFPQLSNELIPHFIRGYFDGDGCLTCHKRRKGSEDLVWVIKFCGTKDMLENIYNNLPKRYNKPINLYQRYNRDNNNYCFDIGGNIQVVHILNYLYKDATIYLERKYQKYRQALLTPLRRIKKYEIQ